MAEAPPPYGKELLRRTGNSFRPARTHICIFAVQFCRNIYRSGKIYAILRKRTGILEQTEKGGIS
mgnify:CR=1 FL=1